MEYIYNRKEPQKSSEIAQYQQRLNYIRKIFHGNWRYLAPDGVFGRGTRDAIRQFQTYANISVTGNLDNPTQANIVVFFEKAKRGYTPAPKAPVSNYQPVNADYSAAPSKDFVPMSGPLPQPHRPAVDTSSIVDSELKSLGKDMMGLVEAVANNIQEKHLKSVADMKKYVAAQFEMEGDRIAKLIARRNNTINARFLQDMRTAEGWGKFDDLAKSWGEESNMKQQYTQKAYDNLSKARKKLQEEAGRNVQQAVERAQRVEKESAQVINDATKSAQNMGKVAKGAKVVNWAINVGTAGYYVYGMANAQSDEEFNQYASKLTNTIATTAIDVGITVGTNVAARFAAGAAGGPAGIAVVALFTVIDVVCLATTGESLSSMIWNFLQGVNWGKAMTQYEAVKRDNKGIMWI